MALTQEQMEEIKAQLEGLSPEEQQEKLQEIMQSLPPEEKEELAGGKQQCPFCLMAEGKIPVTKVYEDNDTLAILDINPATPGHVIVLPKKHALTIQELSEEETSKLFAAVSKVSKAMETGLKVQGVNIYIASGPAAGQTAPHLLVNVIPRYNGDGVKFGWQPKKQPEDEMKNIAEKISGNIPKEKPKPKITKIIEEEEEFVVG